MASSLFTNTLHVCFDSVLAMDNPDSGLSGFLGFPAVLYEDALTEFFLNGSIRDGSTFGKKRQMKFEFRLLSDILAKTISVKAGSFDAVTQERFLMMAAITCGVAINWNRLLFNILKDMVTAGSRQAKGYAVQITLLLENVTNLEFTDSSEFPSYKILTKNTVHRYIAVNDKVGVEEVADVPQVKQTPVKKAVSRKRPSAVDEQIVKKKRTRVGKSAAVATDSTLEAAPVQVVAPISTVPPLALIRKIQKRRRSLALDSYDERVEMPVDPVDQIIEQVIAETAQVETDVGRTNDSGPDFEDQGVKKADETELWFNLSYEEFATREANRPVETGSDTEEEFVTEKVTATDVGVQTETGSDVYLVETPSEQTELFQGTKTAIAAPNTDKNISDDESMTLEAILSTISDDLSLPSTFGEITPILFGKSISIPGVDEGDRYKASLPKINPADKGKAPLQERDPITPILFGKSISIPGVDEGDRYKASLPKINPADKGKAPLQERDPVKGNPVQEQFLLIVVDIELLVQLRERVIDEVDRFFNSFSLKNLAYLKIEDIYEKEGQVLSWAETDSTRIALQRKIYILTKYREFLLRKFLEIRFSNFVPGVATSAVDMKSITSSDSSVDSSLDFNTNDITMEDDAALYQSILPSSAVDIFASLAALRESFSILVANQTRDSRKSSDAHREVLSKITHVERVFLDSLAAQNEAFRGLFKSNCQEAQNDNKALSLALKAVQTQNAILSTDLAATQKEVKDLKVALSKDFDDKLADIRNDLLEFRAETQEKLASLGAHLAELIAFITKGSDDKKGEGSSSRSQLPPDDQNRPSGGSGSRADDPSRYGGGTISREGANKGGDSNRRGDSSGSSKRRRSDSGGGSGGRINYGPYLPAKRDAEYLNSGKRQF
ncbi:patatin-like protein 2 [Dorcoceras hygrometricum]|uniref:Patatin-like protein 2 n=1 Tax=Dorcoceras hygrometricum TaxID=472368 RepID=A0A2Z7BTJ7_9LAMI|nr:patatin-like protein 2 [Dorcoceras hygrometricum]